MKGILLREFVDFAERELGEGGGHAVRGRRFDGTATYPDEELGGLVTQASAASGIPVPAVLQRYGAYLFGSFVALYPVFLIDVDSAFDLLSRIETYVHGEVQKLYPDARFPRFEVRTPRRGRLEMRYTSTRPFADVAEGLIRGCVAHFGGGIERGARGRPRLGGSRSALHADRNRFPSPTRPGGSGAPALTAGRRHSSQYPSLNFCPSSFPLTE